MQHLQYPIGKFSAKENYSEAEMQENLQTIENLPAQLKKQTSNISEQQLATPYRPGGWTVRQVIHHVADSHMNGYCRFKLGMTEDHPTIRPYKEALWAETPDGSGAPIQLSLNILEAVHARWVLFLKTLKKEDWERTIFHPESQRIFRLKDLLSLYAWHSRHHLEHVKIGMAAAQ